MGLSPPASKDFFVSGKMIEMVKSFKYLGQIFSHYGFIDLEIQQRIEFQQNKRVMQVGLSPPASKDFFVSGKIIEMVKSFKYLGQLFSHYGFIDLEIQQRSSNAILVFNGSRGGECGQTK